MNLDRHFEMRFTRRCTTLIVSWCKALVDPIRESAWDTVIECMEQVRNNHQSGLESKRPDAPPHNMTDDSAECTVAHGQRKAKYQLLLACSAAIRILHGPKHPVAARLLEQAAHHFDSWYGTVSVSNTSTIYSMAIRHVSSEHARRIFDKRFGAVFPSQGDWQLTAGQNRVADALMECLSEGESSARSGLS